MFCSNCGAKLPEDAVFCVNCGCKIEAGGPGPENMKEPKAASAAETIEMDKAFEPSTTAQMPPVAPPGLNVDASEPDKQRGTNKTILIVAALVVVFVALILGGVFAYGVFSKHDCTVTFETSGGSTVAAETVEAGQTLSSPQDPTRDGYSFGGWYADSAYTQQVSFPLTPQQNETIYAKWVAMTTPLSSGASSDSTETYSTDATARSALLSYYGTLKSAGKQLHAFVQDTYNRDLFKSQWTRQSDYDDFQSMESSLLSSLEDYDGSWTVSNLSIPTTYASIQSNLVEGSNLLKDRLDIIDAGYQAIIYYGDWATNQEIQSASNAACIDSKKKYDAFNKVMNSIKSELG